jgi:hypothetical protein
MRQLEKIRNATRELHTMYLADQRKYDNMRSAMSADQKHAAKERLYRFENQLQIIAQAINELGPFEVAADQAARDTRSGSTTFYRQLFEREGLRQEHNNQMRTL